MGRADIARGLLAAAEAMDPEIVEARIRGRISEATSMAVMAVMDQQGIAHCRACPARHGLEKRGQDLVCRQHQSA